MTFGKYLAAATLGCLTACAPKIAEIQNPISSDYSGPDQVTIDLLRPSKGGNRVMVQAKLPDGSLGLFMIDTGADISVLTRATSDRLGLEVQENWGIVEGLSGTTAMNRSSIPQLELGGATVTDVEVAVGLAGVRDEVAGMPFAGILGNNVWSNFTVELDYPADTLVLHRPGTVKFPKRSDILIFDGSHILAPVRLTTRGRESSTSDIVIQIDTGAGEILLSGRTGQAFEEAYTEGLEPLWGIGASETLPPYRFLQNTRRIPLQTVEFGGQKIQADIDARWVNFDTLTPVGPTSMRGLLGHHLLEGHNVLLDYHGSRIALQKSRRKPRHTDAHELLLEQDIAAYGDSPDRFLLRAQLHAGAGRLDESIALLERYLENDNDLPEARVFLARLYREKGDLEKAWASIKKLNVEGMVDESEIVAAVNGLILEGDKEQAFLLADDATLARGDNGWTYVALADVLLSKGFPDRARQALLEAVALEENPDAHLLRRARVALALEDRHAAMAHVRKLLQLYPSGGPFLWFYALLVDSEPEAATFLTDMQGALSRLHPNRKPLDFMVAAYRALGDSDASLAAMREGLERDCLPMEEEPLIDNCYAWYWALAQVKPEEALKKIEAALEAEGPRSDFLDTKAMVHLARGEYEAAQSAATAAARMSPQDVYMLWQVERIGDIAQQVKTD
jgi:tetratricopeptide (TPR) repeat protein